MPNFSSLASTQTDFLTFLQEKFRFFQKIQKFPILKKVTKHSFKNDLIFFTPEFQNSESHNDEGSQNLKSVVLKAAEISSIQFSTTTHGDFLRDRRKFCFRPKHVLSYKRSLNVKISKRKTPYFIYVESKNMKIMCDQNNQQF
jgi:hypothetical protein